MATQNHITKWLCNKSIQTLTGRQNARQVLSKPFRNVKRVHYPSKRYMCPLGIYANIHENITRRSNLMNRFRQVHTSRREFSIFFKIIFPLLVLHRSFIR